MVSTRVRAIGSPNGARETVSTGAIPSKHPLGALPNAELTAGAILTRTFGDDHTTEPIMERAGRR